MKLSTRHDIAAPIEYVFERASDFETFERQALRRGISIERVDELPAPDVGMRWNAEFQYRGKRRKLQAELSRFDKPNGLLIQSVSGGVEADFDVEFLPLSRNRTRVRVGLELVPRTITARLLVQSLKLGKARLHERLNARIGKLGKEIEARHRRENGGARER